MESLDDFVMLIRFAIMIKLSAKSKMIFASANVIKTCEKTTIIFRYFYGQLKRLQKRCSPFILRFQALK